MAKHPEKEAEFKSALRRAILGKSNLMKKELRRGTRFVYSEQYPTQVLNTKLGRFIRINCDDIEPGCKKLFNENKIYCFYFYYDSIEIDYVNEESTNNIMTYFDVKYKCYIEAYKLGYYIPELSEILNKNN